MTSWEKIYKQKIDPISLYNFVHLLCIQLLSHHLFPALLLQIQSTPAPCSKPGSPYCRPGGARSAMASASRAACCAPAAWRSVAVWTVARVTAGDRWCARGRGAAGYWQGSSLGVTAAVTRPPQEYTHGSAGSGAGLTRSLANPTRTNDAVIGWTVLLWDFRVNGEVGWGVGVIAGGRVCGQGVLLCHPVVLSPSLMVLSKVAHPTECFSCSFICPPHLEKPVNSFIHSPWCKFDWPLMVWVHIMHRCSKYESRKENANVNDIALECMPYNHNGSPVNDSFMQGAPDHRNQSERLVLMREMR